MLHRNSIRLFLFILLFTKGVTFACADTSPTLVGIFEKVSIESAGVTRHYRMCVPLNYQPERPVGVLFGYHGGGPFSFLVQLRDLGYEDLAEEAYWITISVAAIPGVSWDQNMVLAENKEIILVKDILSRLKSTFTIDENRIYAVGVSAGSSVVRALAIAMPDTMAAVAGLLAGNNLLLDPAKDSCYAGMFVGGSRDTIFTKDGLVGFAKQYPDIYKWDEEFFAKMEPIGVPYFFDEMIKSWQPTSNDLHPYYLNIGHEFPPDDQGTSPPVSFTRKITRFFNTHPRNYRTRLYPAPSRGAPFRDDFTGNNTILSYPRWRTFSADTTGRFGDVRGARFKINEGKLYNKPTDVVKQSGFSGPIAVFAFTDFMRKPFKWETSFTLEASGEELMVYPCMLHDMQGRVVYLSVTSSGWEWAWAEEHLSFHSEYSQRIHTLAKGEHAFQKGQDYNVEMVYRSDAPQWRIFAAKDKTIASGSLPPTIPYLDEVAIGIGVKGLPFRKVSFDYAQVEGLKPLK